jgi:hypothetical protein
MSRRPASFTQSDIRRACKGAPDRTVEIVRPDGTMIRLVPGGNVEEPKQRLAVKKDFRL